MTNKGRILPIGELEGPTYTELDVWNAAPPPRFEVKAAEGAPKVVIVLIDEVGLDNQTPGAEGIGIGPEATRLTGKISKVTIEVKDVQ